MNILLRFLLYSFHLVTTEGKLILKNDHNFELKFQEKITK